MYFFSHVMFIKYRLEEMQKPNKAEIAAKHWFETMAARQRLEEEGATKRRGERSDPVIEG